MEPYITISLSEYESLIKFKSDFIDAYNQKKIILHYNNYPIAPGLRKDSYAIINANDVIIALNEELKAENVKYMKKYDECSRIELQLQLQKLSKKNYNI